MLWWGFSSFFETLAHGLARDRLDHVEPDEPVGQELQRPPRATVRRGAARKCRQPGLPSAVELRLAGWGQALLTVERRVEPLLHEALADRAHGVLVHPEGLGDLLVGPAWAAGVDLQQDLRVSDLARVRLPLRDELSELRPLLVVQPDHVLLVHRALPAGCPARSLFGSSRPELMRLARTGH